MMRYFLLPKNHLEGIRDKPTSQEPSSMAWVLPATACEESRVSVAEWETTWDGPPGRDWPPGRDGPPGRDRLPFRHLCPGSGMKLDCSGTGKVETLL